RRMRLRGLGGTVVGVAHGVEDLFTSEFGAALLLDHHINAPAAVAPSIARAIRRIPAAIPALGNEWLLRFAVDYAGERRPLVEKAKRDDFILRQHDRAPAPAGLRAEPGTFRGWAP